MNVFDFCSKLETCESDSKSVIMEPQNESQNYDEMGNPNNELNDDIQEALSKKKRRRKNHNKPHEKDAKDNKICKIKAFYMNSLLLFLNNNIKIYFNNQKYRIWKIDGKEKVNSNATKAYNNQLFKSEIGKILSKHLSLKYKSKNKDQNINNINILTSKYPFFEELFKIPYYHFYKYKFLNHKPEQDNIIQNILKKTNICPKKAQKIKEIKMNTLETFLNEQKQNKKNQNNFEKYKQGLKETAKSLLSFFEIELTEEEYKTDMILNLSTNSILSKNSSDFQSAEIEIEKEVNNKEKEDLFCLSDEDYIHNKSKALDLEVITIEKKTTRDETEYELNKSNNFCHFEKSNIFDENGSFLFDLFEGSHECY